MTYDPDRDAKAPLEVNPNHHTGYAKPTSGMGMLLGLIALLVVGGFIFYAMNGDRTVATNDSRPASTAPSTTGSGTTTPAPRPATPTPR